MNLLIACLMLLQFHYISCDTKCISLTTCGQCIGYSQEICVWCAQDAFSGGSRCQSASYQKTAGISWCDPKYVNNPQLQLNVTTNLEWLSVHKDNQVQFRPQNIKIKVRPGVPAPFTVAYKPAKDYPLDVYFLIDNSNTMQAHKNKLQQQADEIYKELTRLTNNVRFGVGTFVEKPGFPYVSPGQTSYSFRHHLSLVDNMEKFKHTLSDIKEGPSNLDDPEAGLDALMQAMVCESELEWRNNSIRIIIMFTDNTYHSAGDGKMLGILSPNDMKCHLGSNKYYSKELELDYPSVSQINKVAYDGKFTIIFAALSNVKVEYEQLAKQITGASYSELAPNSNVMAIIIKSYSESVRLKKINYDAPRNIEINMDQECIAQPKRNCEITLEQPIMNVSVVLTVKSCPAWSEKDGYNQNVILSPTGLNDELIVDLEVDCQCDCEKDQGITPVYVQQCSYAGYLQCGICKCNTTRYGDDCRCEGAADDNNITDINKCKQNVNDTKPCNDHGVCRCGKCNCVGASGEFCQFDDSMCPYASNGKKCADNGRCTLGSCQCNSGWRGNDCSCTTDKTSCMAPYPKEVCSGHGECECGVCVNCTKVANKDEFYMGEFCELCEDCEEQRCKHLEDYAVCNFKHDKPTCDARDEQAQSIQVRLVPKNETNLPENSDNSQISCQATLDDDSILIFKFFYKDDKSQLIIQKETELPPKANLYVAIGSAVGTVLLIGLLTLIGWKLVVDWIDKRQYEKFSNDAKAAGFQVNENPIYTAPAVRFSNPVYRKR